MTDTSNAIMDATEERIRQGGYSGFSFREIAADVGVKSSSVHYHFPIKKGSPRQWPDVTQTAF